MKTPSCPVCEDRKKQLENNPKGGCRTCIDHSASDDSENCKECLKLATPYNHYPKHRLLT